MSPYCQWQYLADEKDDPGAETLYFNTTREYEEWLTNNG